MNINEELEKFVPTSEILKKPGPGGRQLSYVDRYYVISTLNRIYGRKWSTEMSTEIADGCVVVRCRLSVGNDSAHSEHTDIGECLLIGSNGRPNENAATEAATQAFKRAASQLGNAFGLHLYRGLEVAAGGLSPKTIQAAEAMAQELAKHPPAAADLQKVASPSTNVERMADKGYGGPVTAEPAASDHPPWTGPSPQQVAAQVETLRTPVTAVSGTLTKPDYNGAIQSAMANAEVSAPPQAPPAQPEVQVDLGRLAAARADVTVWKTRGGPRGIPLGDVPEETLVWYAETYGKNLADKPNPKFEESNRAHLANIKLCLQFSHVTDTVLSAPTAHAQPQREGESWPSDKDQIQYAADNSDIPF